MTFWRLLREDALQSSGLRKKHEKNVKHTVLALAPHCRPPQTPDVPSTGWTSREVGLYAGTAAAGTRTFSSYRETLRPLPSGYRVMYGLQPYIEDHGTIRLTGAKQQLSTGRVSY